MCRINTAAVHSQPDIHIQVSSFAYVPRTIALSAEGLPSPQDGRHMMAVKFLQSWLWDTCTTYLICVKLLQQVAQLAADLQAAKQRATDAQQQAGQMEGMLRSTGERAAAAEDSTRTQGELVVQLQQQLAELKDR
jgi:hypothetical protein